MRLKRLRKQRYLTQQEVGKIIGVSTVAVSGYENGIRSPEIETLKNIATLFETSIDYLVGHSDVLNPNDPNPSHDISDYSLLQENHRLFVDNEVVEKELIKEALDYIRARRIMKKIASKD